MPNHGEDIDDIMSTILQRQGQPKHVFPKSHKGRSKQASRSLDPTPRTPRLETSHLEAGKAVPTHETYKSLVGSVYGQPAQTRSHPRQQRKLKRSVKITLVSFFLIIALGGLGFVFRSQISKTVDDLLAPPSPFSQEIRDDAGFPLYYPTKLPGNFKIESDRITQPEGSVVLYAITDDEGKRINITLQKRPEGISLEPLYAVLSDLKDIETEQFGKVKTGVSAEGTQITNVLAEKTWILINYTKDTIDNAQLSELLNSLRE